MLLRIKPRALRMLFHHWVVPLDVSMVSEVLSTEVFAFCLIELPSHSSSGIDNVVPMRPTMSFSPAFPPWFLEPQCLLWTTARGRGRGEWLTLFFSTFFSQHMAPEFGTGWVEGKGMEKRREQFLEWTTVLFAWTSHLGNKEQNWRGQKNTLFTDYLAL